VERWAQVLVRLTTAMTLDLQAEATAAMHCVLFAMDVGISRVEIETDASKLKSVLTSLPFDMAVYSHLLRHQGLIVF